MIFLYILGHEQVEPVVIAAMPCSGQGWTRISTRAYTMSHIEVLPGRLIQVLVALLKKPC